MTGEPTQLLRGVDRAAFAVALIIRLRRAGVAVGGTGMADFIRVLDASPPRSRATLYWAARISLVHRSSELTSFNAVFDAVFGDALVQVNPNARHTPLGSTARANDTLTSVPGGARHDESGAGLPWVTLPNAVAAADSDSTLAIPQRLPSNIATIADLPFESLSPSQMELLGRWLEAATRTWPTRRSRRLHSDAHGHQICVRATIARSRRTGWEAAELVFVRPVDKPRRVVMLCDVSKSMQAQATAYLHLMRALALTVDAEVFAFATTLTRLTSALKHRTAEIAIEQASAKVTDRFGGTRIATNLQALLASHHGGALRGAIVVIASDGWDGDAPELLAAAMARLRRRAYRVIWINPRVAAPGFEPRVATMAAALPYCDELVPADTFDSLARVITAVCLAARRQANPKASRGLTA